MSLPFVHLTGDPYNQGRDHGRLLKVRIDHNLRVYFDRFAREVKLSRDAVHGITARYANAILGQNKAYHDAMRGIADAANLDFLDIVALNVRYEILYYQFGKLALAEAQATGQVLEAHPDGCTAFAALPEITQSKHLLMGQNWDWIPEVQGAIVRTTDSDGWETLGYTESGIVGTKIGMNRAGLGLAINGLTATDDDWSRLAKPFHVRCYEILRQATLDDALTVISGEARSCSTNFLLAQAPDRVVDVEAGPDALGTLSCKEGCLTHANHFVDPSAIGITEAPNERREYSRRREARLRELLLAQTPLTVTKIQDALKDTQDDPFGICRHRDMTMPPEEHYTTVTAIVMDLNTRTLFYTDGPPDTAPFESVALSAMAS